MFPKRIGSSRKLLEVGGGAPRLPSSPACPSHMTIPALPLHFFLLSNLKKSEPPSIDRWFVGWVQIDVAEVKVFVVVDACPWRWRNFWVLSLCECMSD